MPENFSIALMTSGLHRMFGPDLRSYVEVARMADAAGIGTLLLGDHVVMGDQTARYPYGEFRYPDPEQPLIDPSEPWIDPLVTLAAVASVTSDIRLGTGVLLVPLRHAVVLAKMVATLDALSGGRVELGVGVGWQKEEYEAIGVDFTRRWERLDDSVRACRALWQDTPAAFTAESVAFQGVWSTPLPVQARLPIWYGAKGTEATARRIAELGDGWFPLGASVEDIAGGVTRIAQAMRDADRDTGFGVRSGVEVFRTADGSVDLGRTTEAIAELVAVGVTSIWVVVSPALGLASLTEVQRYIEQIAEL